jgi:undecaprenyl diphosphate synthase
MDLKKKIDIEKLPLHIAIIMDGNGRWAKQRGKQRIFGHRHGVKAVRETTEAAAEVGIQYLTLFAFSTENWNRPKHEVNALMHLLVKAINKETKTLQENNIRLKAIGDLKSLDKSCYAELMEAIDKTSHLNRMTLILALSYSSQWEILEATKSIAGKVKNKELAVKEINKELFKSYLTTAPFPDPELLIRTSGEHRLSNFLLWQLAYSELYFTPKLWPDFRKEDLYEAIIDYQRRERRFGMISEQIKGSVE